MKDSVLIDLNERRLLQRVVVTELLYEASVTSCRRGRCHDTIKRAAFRAHSLQANPYQTVLLSPVFIGAAPCGVLLSSSGLAPSSRTASSASASDRGI